MGCPSDNAQKITLHHDVSLDETSSSLRTYPKGHEFGIVDRANPAQPLKEMRHLNRSLSVV